jgi:hypothetical protein
MKKKLNLQVEHTHNNKQIYKKIQILILYWNKYNTFSSMITAFSLTSHIIRE